MTLILAVGGAREQQVAVGNRRRVRHVVRRRSNFLDHVVFPVDLGAAVAVAVRIQADDLAAVRDVIQPVSFY